MKSAAAKKRGADARDIGDYARSYRALMFEETSAAIRRRKMLAQMRRFPHRRILEVGCGLRPLFVDFGGFSEMTIVEPAADFCKKARQFLRAAPRRRAEKIELLQGYAEKMAKELRARNFDFVAASGLLHEVPDAVAMMRALRAAMPRGAVLFADVPNANSFHRLLAVEMGLIKSPRARSATQKLLQQPRIFDADSLRALAQKTGFSALREGGCYIKPFTHAQMARLAAEGLVGGKMLAGLEKLADKMPQYAAEIFIVARAN